MIYHQFFIHCVVTTNLKINKCFDYMLVYTFPTFNTKITGIKD